MSIQFSCSQCGASIEVDDQCAGGQCECPACKATVDVPQGIEAVQSSATPQEPPIPRMSPPTEAGRTNLLIAGIGILGLLALIVMLLVLVSILLPVFTRPHASSRRVSCAANLRALATSCLTYAEGNRGFLPSERSSIGSGSPEEGQTCIVGKKGLKLERELWQVSGDKEVFTGSGSNPRAYFKLLLGGRRAFMSPKQFVCPQAIGNVGHRLEGADVEYYDANNKAHSRYDFNGSRGEGPLPTSCTEMTDFSYSFQVVTEGRDPEDPSEIRGRPLTNTRDDSRKVLAADRNPYSNLVRNRSELIAGVYGSGTYIYSPNARIGFASPPSSYSTPKDLMGKNANSRNHNQDGQNVAYLDGHAKWNNNSLAGADDDCIWMTLDKTGSKPRIPLTGADYGKMRSKTSWSTDSLLIP